MSLLLFSLWMFCVLLLGQTDLMETRSGTEHAEPECDGAIRERSVGTKISKLFSPAHPDNYPNGATCMWRLVTRAGSRINITALYMDVEYTVACRFDYVKVFDGEDDSAPVLGTFCGIELFSVVTSSHTALVAFHSDVSYTGIGFRLQYKRAISLVKDSGDSRIGEFNECNTTRTDRRGYILSPDYPLTYPPDQMCRYEIRAPRGHTVQVEFQAFALELSDNCSADYLAIVERDSGQQRYCGRKIPPRIRSKGTQLTLVFQSDSLLSYHGFNVTYSFLSANKFEGQDDNADLLYGGDPDCSVIRNVGPGVVSSPLHPQIYPPSKSCITIIQAPKGHTVILDFKSFDLEETLECEADLLSIHDGMTEAATLLGKYCALELSNSTVKSASRGLRLHFHSDYSVQEVGFKADYRFISKVDDDDYVCDIECINGGKCVKDRDGEANCDCPLHYTGKTCSKMVMTCAHTPCKNGATCKNTILGYQCTCPALYDGPHCEIQTRLMFTYISGNQTAKEGEHIIMQCDSNLVLDKVWIFEDATFFQAGGAVAKSRGVKILPAGVLVIEHFTDENSGKYSCYATDRRTEIRADFWVIMDKPCNLVYKTEPSNHTSLEGTSHIFECHVENGRSTDWLKDDIPLKRTARINKLINNYLHIRNIKLSDAGRYTCVSRGDGGCVRRRTAWLEVRHRSGVDEVCGSPRIGSISQRGRITEGTAALEGAHPWFALLANPRRGNLGHGFCGGSLIDKRWIVTAAHCLRSTSKGRKLFNTHVTRVYLGTTDCTGVGGIERRIIKVVLHLDFDHDTFDNDIALLKLSHDVTFNANVLPVCLQAESVINAQFINRLQAGYVIGCGAEIHGGMGAKKLMQVKVPLRARVECVESTKNVVTKNMICAGYTRATHGDSCQGDSGGPLTMLYRGRSVLVGIVSWGEKCDRAGKYGFYTNAGLYYNWINEQLAQDEIDSA